MHNTLKFSAYFGVFLAIGCYLGATAFSEPKTFISIADVTVTAISIIFGLSLTVASLAYNSPPPKKNLPTDQTAANNVKRDVAKENYVVVLQQKFILGVFLATIAAGVSFKYAASNLPKDIAADWPSSLSGAAFILLATLSLGAAIQLPDILFRIHKRDQFYS